MGGFYHCKIESTKEEALALLQKELGEFQKKWDADWWEMRIAPHAERITPDEDGWEDLLELYHREHPQTSPQELWISSAQLHS